MDDERVGASEGGTAGPAGDGPKWRAREGEEYPPDEWYADGIGPRDDEEESWLGPEWARRLCAEVEREQLAAAASGDPGGWSAEVLQHFCPDGREGRDVSGLDAAGLADGIAGLQRLINWAQGSQQRYVAALARPGVVLPVDDLVDVAESPLGLHRAPPDGSTSGFLLSDPVWGWAIRQAAVKVAALQVGCALNVAPSTARSRVERAVSMVDTLPRTVAAQQSGDLDGYRASIIYERSSVLPEDQRAKVERAVLPIVTGRTSCRVRDVVDREVTRIDPDAAAKREQQAKRGRGVRAERGEDGMGSVRADLAAPDAQLTVQVLDRIAAAIQAAGLAQGRGRSQIRADVFADLFRDLAANGEASIGGDAGIGRDAVTDTARTDTACTDAADTAGDAGTHPGAESGTDGDADSSADLGSADGTDAGADADADPDADSGTGADSVTGTDSSAGAHGCTNPGCDSGGPDRARPHRKPAEPADAESSGPESSGSESSGPESSGSESSGPGSSGRESPRSGSSAVEPTGAERTGAAPWVQAAADRASGARPGRRWELPICINVYVHASTLAGWDDQPAELVGHGVITADFARALVESASSVRAIAVHPPGFGPPGSGPAERSGSAEWTATGHSTDPVRSRWCGSVLDAGRSVYRAKKSLADNVTARDRTCQFPGCRAAAEKCDLDHRLPWDSGGATCPCNQDPLCRAHHLMKTFTSWHGRPGPDGALVWTSPTGRRYRTEPGHLLLDGCDDGVAGVGVGEASPGVGDEGRGTGDGSRGAGEEFPQAGGDDPSQARDPVTGSISGLPGEDPPPF